MNLNITETELTELSNGKLKSAPSVTMEVADEGALGGAMNQYFLTDERMGLALAYRFR